MVKSGKAFANELRNKKRALVLLHGDIGAGKTTFVCAVVRELLSNASPSSPTFNIINQYADNIYHVDLYRIKDESELYNIGFFEILDGNNIVFIEWPGKVQINYKGEVYNVTFDRQHKPTIVRGTNKS